MDKSVKFLRLNIYVLYVLLWITYWLMWFESLLVLILFKFKKAPIFPEFRLYTVHASEPAMFLIIICSHKSFIFYFMWNVIFFPTSELYKVESKTKPVSVLYFILCVDKLYICFDQITWSWLGYYTVLSIYLSIYEHSHLLCCLYLINISDQRIYFWRL